MNSFEPKGKTAKSRSTVKRLWKSFHAVSAESSFATLSFAVSGQAEQKNQSHVLPRSLLGFDERESALNLVRPRRYRY